MAIVTGDRYLDCLVRFAERNAGSLLEGSLTLKLNPVGLRYVQSRLEALREVEALLAGAPVDYLRAYVSDLGDHRAIEQLRRILGLLTSLKVASALPHPARDPTPLWLVPFGRLRELELRGCDLSTSAARGLLELRHSLEKLVCHNSTDALRHIFASRIIDVKDSPSWKKLSYISCACNGLVLMDESLQLLPVVETLDLSRNHFAKVDNLRKCSKLLYLDLGFNHLQSISLLSEASCRMVNLILRNNALTTLHGIENLKSLEGLDLSYNIISSFEELEILTSLSSLQNLWLEGNPICCARWYRGHVFSFFSNPEKLRLDGKGITTREYWERHLVIARRQKIPAGYGFYFPAKDDPKGEGDMGIKRKKYSRLVSIEDVNSDITDQDSVSCDSDNVKKEDIATSENESKILSLINKVEYLKKEGSVLWLREFKDYMNHNSEELENRLQIMESNLVHDHEKCMKKRTGENSLNGRLKCVSFLDQMPEDGNSLNMSNVDMPTKDTCNGSQMGESSNGSALVEQLISNDSNITITESGNSGFNPNHEKSKFRSNGMPPLEIKTYSDDGYSPGGNLSSATLTAIEEIMGSRQSLAYSRSPPHYQKDILHRRLYLEEEFLQLSAESHSVGSSDSDTSCSDDDSCELCSNSDFDDSLSNPVKSENEFILKLRIEDVNGRHDKLSTNRLHGHNNVPDTCFGDDPVENHDTQELEKQKGKRKLKRRFITISEGCNDKPVLPIPNGNLHASKVDLGCSCGQHNHHMDDEALISGRKIGNENNSPTIGGSGYVMEPGTDSGDLTQDEYIKNFFNINIAECRDSETSEELVHCECIYQLGSVFQESESIIIRSSKNKLYMLLLDAAASEGVICKILGCHRLEGLRQVVIGLGLQAVRIYLEGDITYLFLTRITEKSMALLSLLRLDGTKSSNDTCFMKSWEQVQVKLLEKYVCGSLKMGIFLYSVLLVWCDSTEGGSWCTRSFFVIERYMLLCIENFVQFGSFTDNCGLSRPYYSLDSCCPIRNIVELVIDSCNICLIRTSDNATSGGCLADEIAKNKQPEETSKIVSWKLKWFSKVAMLNFVSLVKAIHAGQTSSPLLVKCTS